jgi:hypothetical protein
MNDNNNIKIFIQLNIYKNKKINTSKQNNKINK